MSDGTEGKSNGENGELQKQLEAQTERARNFEAKFVDLEKTINDFGGKEGLAGMKADLEALKRKQAGSSDEELDAWKRSQTKEIENRVQDKLDSEIKRANQAETQLHQLQVVDKVVGDWNGRFKPSAMSLIRDQYIKPFIDKDADGFFVKGDDGKPRFQGAKRMTLDDYFSELSEKHNDLLAEQRSTGTELKGSTTTGGSTPSKGRPDIAGLSYAEQVEKFKTAGRATDWK